MSYSLRDQARRLERAGAVLQAVPARLVEAAATVIETSINRQITKDAPRRRIAGGRVGVTKRTIRTGDDPAVLVKAAGPLHLLANPTGPHTITARRKQALATPYGPRFRVQHPGTKGKDTWRHGVDDGRLLIPGVVQETGTDAIRSAFQ